MKLTIRLAALATFVTIWVAGYALAPSLALWSPTLLAFDPVHHLPILTWFVVPYLSFYLMPVALFVAMDNVAALRSLAKGLILIVLVSTAIFIVMPVAIAKPTITSEWHLGGWLLTAVHTADTNANCFPSEHVSLATFCALALGRLRPTGRYVWWLWGTLVVLSTVFTRQHYVTDVVGGLALALVAWRFAKLPKPTARSS